MPVEPGPLTVCVLDGRIATLSIEVEGRSVRLTTLEWIALGRLVSQPGEVVPLDALAAYLYAHTPSSPVDRLRATRCVLRRLRRKLKAIDALPLLQNRRGHGYFVPAGHYVFRDRSETPSAMEEPRRLLSGEGETQSPRRTG